MSAMRLSILVAMAKNRAIGKNNALPWHLSADLKHFRALTMGHPIIMGRKTYESIGRPLPGRTNIIMTRQKGYQVEGAITVNSVDDALKVCQEGVDGNSEVFLIGGAELYRRTLRLCHRIYVTEIQQDFDGDTFFPEFDIEEWQEISREKHFSEDDKLEYHFVMLDRKISLNIAPASEVLGTNCTFTQFPKGH